MEILNKSIFGNNLLEWVLALGVMIVSIIVLRILQTLLGKRLASLAVHTEMQWDDMFAELITKIKFPFLVIIGFILGSLLLELPDRVRSVLSSLLIIALLIQAGIWGGSLVLSLLTAYRQRAQVENPAAITTIDLIGIISKVLIWSVVLLVALDNLGINITSLIAGLGIGGVAVALAVQNILGDLFASLSIVLDKPFLNKDFLIVDDLMGSVEHIGLKTTRIRSLSGEQLVFSNSDLLKSRIRNYGRMFERRVVFNIGVTYQTPREKLQRIPTIIREAVMGQDNTRFDRSHFMNYGDYALQFETVYYVLSPDYNIYMDIQQAIYFTIHERFEQERIEFAYPTQTVFVTGQAGSASA